jgi:hypothetical protein
VTCPDERTSADRLRERLAAHDGALRSYTGDTLYHVQVDYTCQLLDVVDEVTDPVTADLITDVIYERLTGDGVSEAAERIRDARAQYEHLRRQSSLITLAQLRADLGLSPPAAEEGKPHG